MVNWRKVVKVRLTTFNPVYYSLCIIIYTSIRAVVYNVMSVVNTAL